MPRGPDTRGEAAVFLEDSRASHLEGGTRDKGIPSKTDADVPVVGAAALGRAAARHEAGRASYARPCDDGGGGHGREAVAVVVCYTNATVLGSGHVRKTCALSAVVHESMTLVTWSRGRVHA